MVVTGLDETFRTYPYGIIHYKFLKVMLWNYKSLVKFRKNVFFNHKRK